MTSFVDILYLLLYDCATPSSCLNLTRTHCSFGIIMYCVLGSTICDIVSFSLPHAVASYMDTNIALINAGSFRSDCIDRPGKITQQTITSILPFQEKAVVVAYTGLELLAILENAVSQYPLLDGRFLQASGISFKFDPRLSAGKRIHPSDVFCRQVDNSMKQIEEDAVYQVAVKTFLFDGMDGYPKGCPSKVIHRSDTTISSMVSRYLKIANPAEAANMPTISPRCEGRIVCVHPDEDVLHAYKYPKD